MASARVIEFPGEPAGHAVAAHSPVRSERRIKFRYPLDLTVRFRCYTTGSLVSGEGFAVNLSSGGVLVASPHQMDEGALVEMSIEWPLLLDGRTPLQLIAIGRVMRHGIRHFAAAFERYEFRTMKSSVQS